MRINDVEKITGLTQKAIRLYESRGLVRISRDENGYRNYTDDNVEQFKEIKLFRSIGISIADIKLYLYGVLRLDEMLDKRKSEILKESGLNSESYRICERLSKSMDVRSLNSTEILTENEEAHSAELGRLSVGIDIGTTTVSAVVYDLDKGEQLEAYALPHNSYTRSNQYSEQSAAIILEKAEKLLSHILQCYPGVISIGLTGQMHGIVYIDAKGEPCGNLINWQDKRGDAPMENGETICDRIRRITGERVATGYGIATHAYNLQYGLVPSNAVGFCSIMDLFGVRICNLQRATTHTSVAASLGLFDLKSGKFMTDKLARLGIENSLLPAVTGEAKIIGRCKDIPVCVAIGDNQASFLGSIGSNEDSLLVNIGTGSQISAVSDYRELGGDVELRPFVEGKYLICGSALCGGYAYSMVEQFFRSYLSACGLGEESQYKTLNQLALDAYERDDACLDVDVSFFGKRSDPERRGSILGIGRQNFTPAALTLGVLKGMCRELYELYTTFDKKKEHIVASGGAVKNNPLLRRLIAEQFDMTLSTDTVHEEAATGAALFSAFAVGAIAYEDGFGDYVRLKQGEAT